MRLLVPTALACLAPLTAHAGTFTVGPQPGPGIDFTSIQTAIDTAAEGDLIIVNAGAFTESLVVDGKSLTLLGNGAPTLFVNGQAPSHTPLLIVKNLSATQSFDMLGFGFSSFSGIQKDTILLEANQGRIWLEELFIDSFDGHGLHVRSSSDVMLSEVFLQVGAAFVDAQGLDQPAHGLLLEGGSDVRAFSLTANGSHLPPILTLPTTPVPGGDAVRVIDSTLLLIRPDLIGGTGGSVFQAGCSSGASGGTALTVSTQGGVAPLVRYRGGTLVAGASGFFDPSCSSAPPTALAINDPTQAVVQLGGIPRTLAMPSLATTTGSFEFQVRGESRDLFFLFASPSATSATPLAGIDGELLIDAGASFLATNGQLNIAGFGAEIGSFTSPGLPATFRTQALFMDIAGGLWVSGPGSIHFL
jgi:hypothetical protein